MLVLRAASTIDSTVLVAVEMSEDDEGKVTENETSSVFEFGKLPPLASRLFSSCLFAALPAAGRAR